MRHLATRLLFIVFAFHYQCVWADSLSFNQARDLIEDQSAVLFGAVRENTDGANALLTETLRQFMTEPGETRDIGDGMTMVSACNRTNCEEKAGVIIDTQSGKLLAVGLRNYRCRNECGQPRGDLVCDKQPSLLIVLVRRETTPATASKETMLSNRLREWASRFHFQHTFFRTINAN